MKFALIDRIVEFVPGERVAAIKTVSRAEEYLGDHFPTFPVLPGVFLLQAMVEAAGWLVRESNDFNRSIILLRSAKNVTYKSFARPGDVLDVHAECARLDADDSDFRGSVQCQGREIARARFTLGHALLAARDARLEPLDHRIIAQAKLQLQQLRG